MFKPKNILLVTNQLPLVVESKRKLYRKPQLEELGDLRTLTLGGSPGQTDSGTSKTTKPPLGGLIQPGDFPIFNPDGTIRNPDDPIYTP